MPPTNDAPRTVLESDDQALPSPSVADWLFTTADAREKDSSKRGLDGSDLDGRSIEAIRTELKDKSKDAGEALVDAVKKNRIVGIGEQHTPINPLRDFVRELMPKLKEAGATHLAIEADYRCQPVIDEFMRTGKLDLSKLDGILNMKQESFVKLLTAAREAGLKIVAVDNRDNEKGRDPHMAKAISAILEADPKNKVIFWVGNLHLTNAETDPEWQVASQLLKKKYDMASFFSVSGAGTSTVGRLTEEVSAPRVVSTKDAPKLAAVDFLAGNTLGCWDNVLIIPRKN